MPVLTRLLRPFLARCLGRSILLRLLLLPAPALVAAPLAAVNREYAIKAAALYNFIPFIDWPPAAFPSPSSPVIIGILGPDPFGPLIDGLVENENYRGHPIQVRRYHSVDEIGLCHILFVSRHEPRYVRVLVHSAFASRPMLTVSDADDFARDGGGAQFFIQRNRVQMLFNLRATNAAGLKISSKLLRLCDVIEEGQP